MELMIQKYLKYWRQFSLNSSWQLISLVPACTATEEWRTTPPSYVRSFCSLGCRVFAMSSRVRCWGSHCSSRSKLALVRTWSLHRLSILSRVMGAKRSTTFLFGHSQILFMVNQCAFQMYDSYVYGKCCSRMCGLEPTEVAMAVA